MGNSFDSSILSLINEKITATRDLITQEFGDWVEVLVIDPEVIEESIETRISVSRKKNRKTGANKITFLLENSLRSGETRISVIEYDSVGRGLRPRESIYMGSFEDFKKLDISEILLGHSRGRLDFFFFMI